MPNKEFEKLVQERNEWVRLSKKNKFDFDSILAEIYTDPSHFIYEILQNAEDASAKEARFELFEDRLDIYHNGTDFNFKDIEGVTGIGNSGKKEDLTSIGKFGVGFKSVLAVTDTPRIYSGEYSIEIKDFVIPSEIDTNELVKEPLKETLIRLPFNHKSRPKEETFVLVSKKLKNIGLETILFLKNIEEIKWKTPDANGHYLKSSEPLNCSLCQEKNIKNNIKKVILVSSNIDESYIVISKPIKISDKDLKVEIAYKLSKQNNKEIVIPESDNSRLVVYFPTEKVTYLNFLIQGPYKTTSNRENIPLEDDEQNKVILEETANLVAESLSYIKDLGYLDTNFLNLLPINFEWKEKKGPIYSVIYDKVKNKLLNEELLPTSDNKFTKATDALLARGKELTEFLDIDDIRQLFSKQHWLDANITQDKTRELRDYLIREFEVHEIDFEKFSKEITYDFLKTKSDEWMIDFYSRLLNQESLWRSPAGILRTKPIIRLENGELDAPFNNDGKNLVYLPTEISSKYKTVKKSLTENENSLKFLKELGLKEPDLFAEINEFIIPKYQSSNPIKDEGYFDDIEKILKAYEDENLPEKDKTSLGELLKSSSFIDSFKNDTKENYLKRPNETYLNNSDLKTYFEGYQSVFFVSDELYKKFDKKRLENFLKKLCVEDKPKCLEISDLSEEEKEKLIKDHGNKKYTKKDYVYEGLENFIKQMTIDKSLLLWKLLLKDIENLRSWNLKNFLTGKYIWSHYRNDHNEKFESKLLKLLKQNAWLIDKNKNFRKSSEITSDQLIDDYRDREKNPSSAEELIGILGIKPEIYKNNINETIADELNISRDDVKKMMENLKNNPEIVKSLCKSSNNTPTFPTNSVDNRERREKRVADNYNVAPEKVYEKCERNVRTSRAIDSTAYLTDNYTNENEQMVCQICKEEMPFKKRDGHYYFEKVEALSSDYLKKEHEAQFLALCPLCAAMYKELIKKDEEAMKTFFNSLKSGNEPSIPIKFQEEEKSIRFTNKHFVDIRTIINIAD